jgi:hypothetical protein
VTSPAPEKRAPRTGDAEEPSPRGSDADATSPPEGMPGGPEYRAGGMDAQRDEAGGSPAH